MDKQVENHLIKVFLNGKSEGKKHLAEFINFKYNGFEGLYDSLPGALSESKADILIESWFEKGLLTCNRDIKPAINLEQKSTKMKEQKAFHTFKIGRGKTKRNITVGVITLGNDVCVGYSVCMPEDEFQMSLAKKIARGRALSKNKLGQHIMSDNLINEYYMLKSIAAMWANRIEKDPSKYIKGIKA